MKKLEKKVTQIIVFLTYNTKMEKIHDKMQINFMSIKTEK
jgi:hypothetical protein